MSLIPARWRSYVKRTVLILLGLLFFGYLVVKAHRGGNDINVYLHAAGQLLQGQPIYASNPYNLYLYSPLFALVISPLSLLDMPGARVLWMLLNLGLTIRLWFLLTGMRPALTRPKSTLWAAGVVVLSLGFLNHNFALGQVTILILWLTVEGIIRAENRKPVTAALCIALGINFKIIPLLVLIYFGMKGHFKAIIFTLVFLVISILLPGIFIGFKYNAQLHAAWKEVINPAGERFVFEDLDGCHSLNAVLPAYFYDFSKETRIVKPYERNVHYPRMIMDVPHDLLAVILLVLRILVFAIFFCAVLPRSWLAGRLSMLPQRLIETLSADFHKTTPERWPVDGMLLRDIGFLCLVTLLVFPHQMKYSMLYFVPVGASVLYFFLKKIEVRSPWTVADVCTGMLTAVLMCILAVMGRDIIGNHLVDVLDYYHFMGISNLVFLGILWYCDPQKVRETIQ